MKTIQFNKEIYSGGKGWSIEDAIIINLKEHEEGVQAEYDYIFLHEKMPWAPIYQKTSHCKERSFDIISIKQSDYKVREYWFDIGHFMN